MPGAGAPGVRTMDAQTRPVSTTITDSDRGRRPPKLLVYTAVALVVLSIAAYLRGGLSSAPKTKADETPVVTAAAPGMREVVTQVTVTGAISARDEMPITVVGEGGRVAAILVEVGDAVRRGQVLARLDTAVAAPQVGSLLAALEEARANAELAEGDFSRAQAVASSGALAAQEIQRRRSQAVSARARVRVAEAQLAESRARLRRTDITAPQDGLVLTRSVEVGQTVSGGGEPMFRLGRGGAVEMRGRVSEQDLPKLAVGQGARVVVTGVAQPFNGTVRLLGAVIDPQTRLGSVRIELPSDRNLRPGAFARAEIEVSRAQRVVVPQTAVLADKGGSHVLVIAPDDTVKRLDVVLGGTRAGGLVVESGLQGSERVVTAAAAYLRVGEKVRLAPVAPPAVAAGERP